MLQMMLGERGSSYPLALTLKLKNLGFGIQETYDVQQIYKYLNLSNIILSAWIWKVT